MSPQLNEEEIVKISVELLLFLTSPTYRNEDEKNSSLNDFDDALSARLNSTNLSDTFKSLIKLIPVNQESTWPITKSRSQFRWKFIQTALQLMKIIHNVFIKSTNDKVKLLSISQKKILEGAFEFVMSLGVLQNLLPGVGVPLECRIKHIRKIPPENLGEFAKYRRLCRIMDDLFYLLDVDIFHDLIVTKHLEDVLAGLLQLSSAPLKIPNNHEDEESIDFNSIEDDFEIKHMTFSMWKKLEENRKNYSNYLEHLFQGIYLPLCIRKLSLLLNSKNSPRWMKRKITKIFSDVLKKDHGVSTIIKAFVESESLSPAQSSHSVSIAKLIAYECLNNDELIVTQLLKILESERKQPSDIILIQIAGLTISKIFSDDSEFAKVYIFDEIYKPFKFLEFSTEDEICNVIHQLYNLFIVPTNNIFSVPISVILPSCRILFSLHCRVKVGLIYRLKVRITKQHEYVCLILQGLWLISIIKSNLLTPPQTTIIKFLVELETESVCYLKSDVKALLLKLLSETDETSFNTVMNCFIFDAQAENIFAMPSKKCFSLSANGGVRIVDSDNDFLDMEYATVVLDLLKAIPENEKVVRSLFIYLLKKFIDESKDEKFAQKRLIVVILLTELSQCPTTLRFILKDSENIIKFVGDLLRVNTDTIQHDDIICVALTFLTMVIYDAKKNVSWDIFNMLLPTVKKFELHSTPEVKFLAEEVCNLIRTHGLIGNIQSPGEIKEPLIQDIVQSDCERHIEEACHPLLPVRAHALMELISLIRKGDPETLAKKEKIYCLFEENLKDQDSFLYLRAIEGLSCMAALKSDVVLPLLCREFLSSSTSSMQLKIGEVLMRTTKFLNDFVHLHKKLLVCTFMNGIKGDDSLVRASSLSNLAEICLMLKNNVEDMLYEVLSCALSVAQFDKDVEPRRAAILLVSGLFRGLKTSIFTALEAHLVDLYKILRRIRSYDVDEVVRIQAVQALETLDDITRKFLSSKPKLEKKMHVIRPL